LSISSSTARFWRLVADEADVPAGQLIGLLLRQVAGQNDESVAEREQAAERVENAAINRRRKIIAEDRGRQLDLLEDHYGQRRVSERRRHLRQCASGHQLFV
jgi:hypothetical protein